MSLRDGSKKMSKSDPSEYSLIALTDDADAISAKIRKAKTDPGALPSEVEGLAGRPEADNLVGIYAALADETKQRRAAALRRRPVLAVQERARRADGDQARADPRRDPAAQRRSRLTSIRCSPKARARRGAIAQPNMDAVKDIVGLIR